MDWKIIIQYLKHTPTSVLQLVNSYPTYIGYSDACKYGMGRTWSAGTKILEPTVLQVPILEDIQNRLCTHTNKKGDITMNDLDLAAEVLSFLVFEYVIQSLKLAHVEFLLWQHVSCAMGIQTTHQQVYSSSMLPLNVGNPDPQHTGILTYSNIHSRRGEENGWYIFTCIQTWKILHRKIILNLLFQCHISSPTVRFLEGVLTTKKTDLASDILHAWRYIDNGVTDQPSKVRQKNGNTGKNVVDTLIGTHISPTRQNWKKELFSLLFQDGSGQATIAANIKSQLKWSQTQSWPSPRPLN